MGKDAMYTPQHTKHTGKVSSVGTEKIRIFKALKTWPYINTTTVRKVTGVIFFLTQHSNDMENTSTLKAQVWVLFFPDPDIQKDPHKCLTGGNESHMKTTLRN